MNTEIKVNLDPNTFFVRQCNVTFHMKCHLYSIFLLCFILMSNAIMFTINSQFEKPSRFLFTSDPSATFHERTYCSDKNIRKEI